jgi:gamma-glutamyltranspeptidase/glutathione hydrolase
MFFLICKTFSQRKLNMVFKNHTKQKMKQAKLLKIIPLCIAFLFGCKTNKPFMGYTIQKTALSEKAMVVSAHPLATQVGLDILRKGGNAIDAAIAVQLALAVTYPRAGNLGGGGFLVYRSAKGETATLDFREKAPAAARRDMYLDKDGNVLPNKSQKGHLAAGIPGTIAGCVQLYDKYSKLKNFKQIVQPAIDLAENGFEITDREANNLNNNQADFTKFNTIVPVFVKKPNENWKKGDILLQKDLAHTLTLVRDNGRAGFYEGEIAEKIVAEMQRGGGIITKTDLQKYQATWRKPLTGKYRGYDLVGMPPPSSGGIALFQLLGIVEQYPLGSYGFHSKAATHLIIEAERRVYADRAEHLGDPDFYPVPTDKLLNSNYLQKRMSDFDPNKATPSQAVKAGNFKNAPASEQTTHFSIIDAEGNAVAVTTTLNDNYGCRTVVGGAGFLLNNEMDDFSAKPGVPNMYGAIGGEANAIQAGKTMLSSMTPTIVSKGGKLFMVVGTPGGTTIITSVFQVITNVIDFKMSISEAVQAKRFHSQWLPDKVFIEKDCLENGTNMTLKTMGHHIEERGNLGAVEAILVRGDGKLEGAADIRGDDDARGF